MLVLFTADHFAAVAMFSEGVVEVVAAEANPVTIDFALGGC